MSAGSSSQLAACFSVDRTKYLMFSKSIPDRSEPQVGMGLRRNSFRPFSRRSSIHCGSSFSAEMSRTTSSDRPRRADAPAARESRQPHLYRPRDAPEHIPGQAGAPGLARRVRVGPAELVPFQPVKLWARDGRHGGPASGLSWFVSAAVVVPRVSTSDGAVPCLSKYYHKF